MSQRRLEVIETCVRINNIINPKSTILIVSCISPGPQTSCIILWSMLLLAQVLSSLIFTHMHDTKIAKSSNLGC